MAQMMYWEAIRRAHDEEMERDPLVRRAHDEEMERDPLVICMGEDIGVAGGTYKATQGLYDKYGPERVIDTPISENGYTGLGIGASFLGVRPIIEIMPAAPPTSWAPSTRRAWRRSSWASPGCAW